MPPVFFGSSTRQLYGVYHPPLARPVSAAAVLICPGFGHEYMRTHRAFVRMAEQLALKGYPVFRYDHEGTGDSAGEMDEATLPQLEEGVAVAAEELLAMSEAPRVALIGHRLGAWLALRSAGQLPCRAVVLIDPVQDGADYVRLLRKAGKQRQADRGGLWVHGYPWAGPFLDAIETAIQPSAYPTAGLKVLSFSRNSQPGWERVESRLNEADLLLSGPLTVPEASVAHIADFLARAG